MVLGWASVVLPHFCVGGWWVVLVCVCGGEVPALCGVVWVVPALWCVGGPCIVVCVWCSVWIQVRRWRRLTLVCVLKLKHVGLCFCFYL